MVSLVGRPLELLHPHVHPGARLLVLGSDGETPAQVAAAAAPTAGTGRASSPCWAGSAARTRRCAAARRPTWLAAGARAGGDGGRVPGRARHDAAADHAGPARRRLRVRRPAHQVRGPGDHAVAAGRRSPGSCSGTSGRVRGPIGIEWMRAHPNCRAVAVEADEERAARIARNAARLGVPYLRVVHGAAPEVLGRLGAPDAVFIGGGLTTPRLLERCWDGAAARRPAGGQRGHRGERGGAGDLARPGGRRARAAGGAAQPSRSAVHRLAARHAGDHLVVRSRR